MLAKIIINKQLTTFVTAWEHMNQVRRECEFNNSSFSASYDKLVVLLP